MNTEQFRSAVNAKLVAWANANFPTMPVIFENGPVPDEDKIGTIWLDVEVRWYGAHATTFGGSGRHTGAISANVFYRDASGTSASDKVIDSFETEFKSQRIGSAVLAFPQRTVPTNLKGWYKTGALLPFYLDV